MNDQTKNMSLYINQRTKTYSLCTGGSTIAEGKYTHMKNNHGSINLDSQCINKKNIKINWE